MDTTHFAFAREDGQFFVGFDRGGEPQWSDAAGAIKLWPFKDSGYVELLLKRYRFLVGCSIVTFSLAVTGTKKIGIVLT